MHYKDTVHQVSFIRHPPFVLSTVHSCEQLWRWEGGAKGGIHPGWHCAGGGIWKGKNMEF